MWMHEILNAKVVWMKIYYRDEPTNLNWRLARTSTVFPSMSVSVSVCVCVCVSVCVCVFVCVIVCVIVLSVTCRVSPAPPTENKGHLKSERKELNLETRCMKRSSSHFTLLHQSAGWVCLRPKAILAPGSSNTSSAH